jgi:hypothetical protein
MNRLLLFLVVCAAAAVVRADHRDDERRDRPERGPRVIVYQDADYRGNFLVLYPGDALENLSEMRFGNGSRLNDAISSIRVEDGAEVFVYENAHYRGQVMRLTESVRDLTGRPLPDNPRANWNDRISSLRVGERRHGDRREDNRRDDERRENPEIIIKRVFVELLAREPSSTDLRYYRGLIIDQGWTEQMVREQLRHGDEFRREGADRIVRRAYREVLDREPDPNGLKQYRRAVLEKDWTEGDVRDDLRRSQEYQKKNGGR